jgi:hypothetical protein
LVLVGAAALCPAAIALGSSSISVSPEFPTPRFGIGEEVSVPSEDNPMLCNRGIIIGLAFEPASYYSPGWWYLISWTDLPESPRMEGADDGNFLHESQIRALS